MKLVFVGRKDHGIHPTVKEFIALAQTRNHTLIFCNPEEFIDQDLIDVDIVCLKIGYTENQVWNHLGKFPHLKIINSIMATKACNDRLFTNTTLAQANLPIPKYALSMDELKKLNYPIIVKNRDANIHEMENYYSFEEVPNPDFDNFTYQEFIAHDGFDYKGYVAGSEVFFLKRPASKAKYHQDKIKEGREHFETDQLLGQQIKKIGKLLKVEIYGVDFVKEVKSGNFFIVDVNLFPGFIGVKDAALSWWNHCENILDAQSDKK